MRAALRAVDTDPVMIPGAIYCEAQHTVKQGLAVDAKANKKRNAPEFEGFYIRPLFSAPGSPSNTTSIF